MLLLILLLALLIPPLLDADDDEDEDDDDDDEVEEDEEDLEVLLPGKSRRIWPIFCSLSDFPAAAPELPALDARLKLLPAEVADSRWLASIGRGMVPLPP